MGGLWDECDVRWIVVASLVRVEAVCHAAASWIVDGNNGGGYRIVQLHRLALGLIQLTDSTINLALDRLFGLPLCRLLCLTLNAKPAEELGYVGTLVGHEAQATC